MQWIVDNYPAINHCMSDVIVKAVAGCSNDILRFIPSLCFIPSLQKMFPAVRRTCGL